MENQEQLPMPNRHKNISRVKTGKTDGWQVRLCRDGVQHSKFFSVQRYDDLENALEAAKQYRNVLVKMAPASKINAVQTDRDSGIHLEKSGGYTSWVAQWVDENGERRTKKFNVKKYGRLRSQQMARQARLMGIARIDKPQPKPIPTLDALLK